MMEYVLDAQEVRILGCLLEKELATPEYYPLSLNALTNACNQKTNREPVMDYDEETILAAVGRLMDKKMVDRSMVGRVPKYEELFMREHNLVPKEAALLCVLLLRGPQTVGELRGRTSRMVAFDSIEAMQETMKNLLEWGMIRQLPRMPGQKESRYDHLLSASETEAPSPSPAQSFSAAAEDSARLDGIEKDIEELKTAIAALRQEFEAFKDLFG